MRARIRHQEEEARCWVCSGALQRHRTGRPRKFCSNACRQKAARSRNIIAMIVKVEKMRLVLAGDDKVDWSDEDHRVA